MSNISASDIQVELENRFLTYALSTIVSRSLPDARDGLKPIHRRILFAMNDMGVTAAAKHVKSAKIIGETLGKYHPHGDASTYESMVRMAQDFSLRYPLVDGKGNFGSIDGDQAAAYRYTEAKLTPISSFLLNDLKKDTVDFRSNYDNTLQEPSVLPSRIPNLLINGSSGIAVGMACSFPAHNLRETISALIALIETPGLSVSQLTKHIKGPDFPSGGIILNSKADLRKAYETGSGSVKIRGEWTAESLPRGKTHIVVHALPYGVNKARLIEKIAEIIIAKKIPALVDIRDESDEKIRVVLEIKSGGEPDKIMAYLLKHTDLETNFQLNFTCLKPNGEPARLSLLEICRYFLDFRKDVVTRRRKYELALLVKRLHILEGFAVIFDEFDKALRLIRSSKSRQEAQEKLKKAFKLDDEQVGAVLEIPLYRLVSMEISKILAEKSEKTKEKAKIEGILKSSRKVWKEVREELEEIVKTFGDKRKTKIKTVETVEISEEDFIEDEEVFIVLSRNGWIRKFKTLADPASLKFKENDSLLGIAKANSKELTAIFTSFGMVYAQRPFNLPYTRSGFGDPVQTLFKFRDGEKPIFILSLDPKEIQAAFGNDALPAGSGKDEKQSALDFSGNGKTRLECIAVSDAGFGFRFPLSNLSETTRSGRKIMSLKEGETMLPVKLATASHVLLVSEEGKGLVIPMDQISPLAGAGRGVKLMNVGNGKLADFKPVSLKDKITLELEDGGKKEISAKKIPVYKRGSQGVILSKRRKVVGITKL
ncbi:MAG: DNA topoisomerase (ATP-hydrolyzing) subunit A [Nitrospinales bacterium]